MQRPDMASRAILLLAACAAQLTHAGTHSVEYRVVTANRPGCSNSRFVVRGYTDGEPYLVYDSLAANDSCVVSSEPAPTSTPVPTERHRAGQVMQCYVRAWNYRVQLFTLHGCYNESSDDAPYRVLVAYACDGYSGRHSTGHIMYAYEGIAYTDMRQGMHAWLERDAETRTNADGGDNNPQHSCLRWLFTFLVTVARAHRRTVAPRVHITRHQEAGLLILRCWAVGFYPEHIEMSWLRDGVAVTGGVETRPRTPLGDGTFLRETSIETLLEDEARVACKVNHGGLMGPTIVPAVPTATPAVPTTTPAAPPAAIPAAPGAGILVVVAAAAAIFGAVAIFVLRHEIVERIKMYLRSRPLYVLV